MPWPPLEGVGGTGGSHYIYIYIYVDGWLIALEVGPLLDGESLFRKQAATDMSVVTQQQNTSGIASATP